MKDKMKIGTILIILIFCSIISSIFIFTYKCNGPIHVLFPIDETVDKTFGHYDDILCNLFDSNKYAKAKVLITIFIILLSIFYYVMKKYNFADLISKRYVKLIFIFWLFNSIVLLIYFLYVHFHQTVMYRPNYDLIFP